MKATKIEWTDRTWNPVTGCTKHSEGCAHCYAETMSRRLKSMKVAKYQNAFRLTLHEECLKEPLKWRKQHNIFVCSMSDLFHNDVPFSFIDKVFEIIRLCPQHRFQILTKRAERMAEYFKNIETPKNVWLGVTVENKFSKGRIDFLRGINAEIHFLSCEPLLEDLGKINLENIQWIIVGGESGSSARQMQKIWVDKIKEQAVANDIPFFFKQWGTWGEDGVRRSKSKNGKILDGEIIQQMPFIDDQESIRQKSEKGGRLTTIL